MKPISELYDMFKRGDHLNTPELVTLNTHFNSMASDLYKSGPVFRLAACEAMSVANTTDDYIRSRQQGK